MKFCKVSLLIAALSCSSVMAEEHVIKMLNNGADGSMVFEPAFVQAKVGDTLRFEPAHSGHFISSLDVPQGAEKWQSELDKPYVVELAEEGLYPYACPPHMMNAMFGLVQVGAPVNLESALKAIESAKGRMFLNPQRVDAIAARIER